jgi:predicted RNA-binding protein with PUA-like domain
MAKRCWLMKSEPESFGIDDLARVKVEPWTGVRNFQARNFMRDEMQVGDDVLFYHSNAEPSGVVGLARVQRTGVVDETQFEPSSQYYDPKARRDAPTWICVEVAYVATLPRLLSLEDLRAEPRLAEMVVLRKGMRLSVQPVSGEHFAAVVDLAHRAPAATAAGAERAKAPSAPRRGQPARPVAKAPRVTVAKPGRSAAVKPARPATKAKANNAPRATAAKGAARRGGKRG